MSSTIKSDWYLLVLIERSYLKKYLKKLFNLLFIMRKGGIK